MADANNYVVDAPPTFHRINFKKVGLKEYQDAGFYACIIDNALTKTECDALLKSAECTYKWEQAQVNVGGNAQRLNTSYRNSERMLVDDFEKADFILNKVRKFVSQDIGELDPRDPAVGKPILAFGHGGIRKGEKRKYKLTRLNERLRFLRYSEGEFFRAHYDGSYHTPDYSESSYLTLQLYLNDSTSGSPTVGGATRFWSPRKDRHFDVEPKTGRVLIFQHGGLLHSGERVTSGVKMTIRTDIMYRRLEENEDLEDLLDLAGPA